MRVIIEFDYDQKVNLFRVIGDVVVDNFLMYLRTSRTELKPDWIIILDMDFSTPDFKVEEIDEMTNASMKVNQQFPVFDVIIITKNPLTQSQAAIWGLLRNPEHDGRTICVVKDMKAALIEVGKIRSRRD